VQDPELDRSVVEMGFIERVEVEAGEATVEFRLPTFWCAANFAYLMAWDMRVAVEALPGIATAHVRLLDHFAAGKINVGVAGRHRFEDVFGGEAGGGLDPLRRTFLEKAYLSRQLAVVDEIKARGDPAAGLIDLDVDGLRRRAAAIGGAMPGLVTRYLSLRDVILGRFCDRDPAFVSIRGERLPEQGLVDYWRAARRNLRSMAANAEMCRMLLDARRSHPVPASEC
jgi:metal-sulfur cluster biosynthetic enzyme